MDRPVISFLTDFGPESAPAICRGVMLGIAPDAQIVDISHSVRKYAIRDGAYLVWSAVPWMPVGFHVVVVDPGVGTARRPIGIKAARGDILIGPDNGVLLPAAEALGGVVEARVLENRDLWLERTSSTFHGRDIFAPVAANLAIGRSFEEVGPQVELSSLVPLHFPAPTVHDGSLETSILFIDSFGNIRLAGLPTDLAAATGPLDPGRTFTVEFGATADAAERTEWKIPWARTFGERPVGAPLIYENSFGGLAIADNQGNAAARLGVAPERPVRIRPA